MQARFLLCGINRRIAPNGTSYYGGPLAYLSRTGIPTYQPQRAAMFPDLRAAMRELVILAHDYPNIRWTVEPSPVQS
jgi:hypothetical protein